MKAQILLSLFCLTCLTATISQANVVGDVDGDNQVTLVEAVSALRVVSGIDDAAERMDELFSGEYWVAEYGVRGSGHGTEFWQLSASGEGLALIEELEDSDGPPLDKTWVQGGVMLDGTFLMGDLESGIVSGDGNLFAAVGYYPFDSSLALLLGIKQASNVTNSLFSGTYFLNTIGIDHDLSDPDHWTSIMEVTSDGAGNFAWNVLANSRGDTGAGNGTYTVESDGTISLGGNSSGVVSPDGNVMMNIDTDPTDETLSIDIAIKGSSSADNSLLSGTYLMCEIGQDPDHWVGRLKVTFDGIGNTSWEMVENSNGDTGTGSVTYSIASNGRVTFSTTNGGIATGIVSPDGELFSFVDLSNQVMSFQVGIKMSDVP